MSHGARQVGKKRRRLREMLDQTTGYIGLLAPDGTLLDVNRAPLEASGFEREAVIGKPFWDTGWWNRSPAVQETLRAAIATAVQGHTVHDEAAYFTASGAERAVDRSLVPVHDDTGSVAYIIAEGRDITERKALERALAASEARFRQMFRRSPASLLITRLQDGLVLEASDAFLSANGVTREAVVGRTALELGWWENEADRAEFVRLVDRLGSARNMTMRARSGSRPSGQLLVSFERLEIDGAPCVLTTQLDVTARERGIVLDERQRISADLHDSTVQALYATTLRLSEAERALTQGSGDTALALTHVQESRRSLLETIRATRAIVDGLASHTSAEGGLRAGLWALADELESGTRTRVRVVVAEDADQLLDPHTVGTLLLVAREAVSNAARHSGATTITLALTHDGEDLELSVVDNGCGFEVPDWLYGGLPPAPDALGDSAAGAPTTSHRGLRIMAHRAAQIGGRLYVLSAPGGGTAVRARLPRALPIAG